MEQFRQIGEVVGSLKALMIFQDDIQINRRQCCLLVDMLTSAYKTIAEEMKKNLKYEEKSTKWKVLENPLKELLRVFKEGDVYIRQCLDIRDWWVSAIILYQNTDCIELHIHNLLCHVPMVIEAIEIAGEFSGWDQDEMQKRKYIYSQKYQRNCRDPKIFQWKFGKQYLVSQDLCNRINSVWDEDRWILLNKIKEMKTPGSLNSSKQDQRLADVLLKNLNESYQGNDKLLNSSILVASKDYQVRRRLGNGSQYKEIQWLGESFALRHFFGDLEVLIPDNSQYSALSHPNIMHLFCGFADVERKEYFMVMELMSKDMSSYIKEICGPRKRLPFSLPVAVDLMLQIARGMEYLHAKKIYHGDLNPYNILLKTRNITTGGYVHAKVSGFGLSPFVSHTQKTNANQNSQLPFIWYAPEVLAEQEQPQNGANVKYTEKADIYSFGMICFQLLTGKVPFEDSHLQGDKMTRNIRAGERPLFSFDSPKYVTNLTKKCWHTDPNQRPTFSSICRILRYVKKFLVMNPNHSQPDPPMPLIDYNDIEAGILKSFPSQGNSDLLPVTEIPFQMFAYRVAEKEKLRKSFRETSESGSDGASACGDDNVVVDDTFQPPSEKKYVTSQEIMLRRLSSTKKSQDGKANKQTGTPKGRSRPPQMNYGGRTIRMNSESQLLTMSPIKGRRRSGHVSDSELS